jgi:hypothetical protein
MQVGKTIVVALVLAWAGRADLSAAEPSAEPPVDVICRLNNGIGKLHASGGSGGTDIKITGAAGGYNGNATITFGSGAATPRLKFRFAGLRTLESFTVSTGKHSFQGQLGWGAGRTVAYFDRTGKRVASAPLAAVTMVMQVTKAGDVDISITASRDVELGRELKVGWVFQRFERRLGKGGEVLEDK